MRTRVIEDAESYLKLAGFRGISLGLMENEDVDIITAMHGGKKVLVLVTVSLIPEWHHEQCISLLGRNTHLLSKFDRIDSISYLERRDEILMLMHYEDYLDEVKRRHSRRTE